LHKRAILLKVLREQALVATQLAKSKAPVLLAAVAAATQLAKSKAPVLLAVVVLPAVAAMQQLHHPRLCLR
jgi:hypothetical protein